MTDNIDKGALRYSITVSDDFSSTTRAFREEMARAETAWEQFRNSASNAGSVGAGMRAFVTASQRAAVATEEAAAANEHAAEAALIRQRAEEKVVASVQRRLVLAEAERIAAEQGIRLSAEQADVLTLEQKAQEKLAAVVEKRALQSRVQALADEQGIRLTQSKAEVLTAEQKAQEKLVALVEKRALASRVQQLADEQGIRTVTSRAEVLSVQEQAERRLSAIIEQRQLQSAVQKLADESGIVLSESKVAVLSAQEKVEAELLATEQKLELVQAEQGNAKLAQLNAQLEVLKRINASEAQRTVEAELAAKGRSANGAPVIPDLSLAQQAQQKFAKDFQSLQVRALVEDIKDASPQFQKLEEAVKGSDGALSGFLGTVKSIGAAFLIFQSIRTVIEGFKSLVSTAIQFNTVIEKSAIDLGAIFVATSNVVTAQGETLKGAKAFAAAQEIARQQTEKLRAESLGARGNFEEILKTFQTLAGAGLTAGRNIGQGGLGVNQIRELAIQVSDAAGALGVQEETLAADIRSIILGAFTKGANRLGKILDITPADIQNAKEGGRLAEFLSDKLKAFNQTGAAALVTFEGLLKKVKDVFSITIGQGASGLFGALKDATKEIFDALTTTNDKGLLAPKPEIVTFFRTLAESATTFLASLRQSAVAFDFRGLAGVAINLSDAFSAVAQILLGVITGFFNGLRDLSFVVTLIRNALGDLQVLGGADSVKQVLALLTEMWVVAKGFKLAIDGAGVTLGFMTSGLGLTVALLILAAVFTKQWADETLGVKSSFGTVADLLGNKIDKTLERFKVNIEFIKLNIEELLVHLALSTNETGEDAGVTDRNKRLEELGKRLAEIDRLQTQVNKDIAADNNNPANTLEARLGVSAEKIKGVFADLAKEFPALAELIKSHTADALGSGIEDAKVTLVPRFATFGQLLAEAFGKGFKDVFSNIQASAEVLASTLHSTITQFSSFVADAVVDAFDPTKKVDILQRFAQFLQAVSKQIISTFVAIATAKAVLGLVNILGGGAGVDAATSAGSAFGDAALSRAEGGPVPSHARASLAHYSPRARGMRIGGFPRPAGIDPRDTVPAWLQPGEFVMKLAAVQTYGAEVMNAINEGFVNPSVLSEVAAGAPGGVRAPVVPSFAGGGSVTQAAAGGASGPSILPAIVADERTMQHLLSGGPGAFFAFLEQNKGRARSSLGISGIGGR